MPHNQLKGCGNFRIKLALSLITLRPIRITQIRSKSTDPGIHASELSLLKLIDEITNGTVVEINDTGTNVKFEPGTLIGGSFDFSCSGDRGIGYFLEFLLIVAPFCKSPMEINLLGFTNIPYDPSVDMIKQSWLPVYRTQIGASAASTLKLEIVKRGLLPDGGGLVSFHSKPSTSIVPISKLLVGKVFRIRGMAWTCRVTSSYGHKLMHGAKSLLNKLLSDVYVTVDHRKDEAAGLSPGFGITLWAETKEGVIFCAEAMSEPAKAGSQPVDAEATGRIAASRLLDQIYHGGYIDSGSQSTILLLMACEGGRNANQLVIGPPTSYTVSSLRLIRDFLGVTFHFKYQSRNGVASSSSCPSSEPSDQSSSPGGTLGDEALIATCFGAGVQNIGRAVR